MLDCDEEGGARVSRRTRESPETRAGSGEPELENGVSKTYLRAPDHAKLGDSVPRAEWWAWLPGAQEEGLDKGRGLLRKGGAPPTGAELRRKRRSLEGRGLNGAGHRDRGRSVTVCARTPPPAPGVPVTRQRGAAAGRAHPAATAPGPSRGETQREQRQAGARARPGEPAEAEGAGASPGGPQQTLGACLSVRVAGDTRSEGGRLWLFARWRLLSRV